MATYSVNYTEHTTVNFDIEVPDTITSAKDIQSYVRARLGKMKKSGNARTDALMSIAPVKDGGRKDSFPSFDDAKPRRRGEGVFLDD